jgi:hypothetical protein
LNNKLIHRAALEKMLLKDALQSAFGDAAIFNGLWMDNHNGAIRTDAQAVGNGAGNMLRMAGVVKAVLLDQFNQPFFQPFAAI